MWTQELPLGPWGMLQAHLDSPALWASDLLPLLFGALGWLLMGRTATPAPTGQTLAPSAYITQAPQGPGYLRVICSQRGLHRGHRIRGELQSAMQVGLPIVAETQAGHGRCNCSIRTSEVRFGQYLGRPEVVDG